MQSNSQTTLSNDRPFGFGSGQGSSLRKDAPDFAPKSSSVVDPKYKKQAPVKSQTVLSQPRREYNIPKAPVTESKQHENARQSLHKRTEVYRDHQSQKFHNKGSHAQPSNQATMKQKDKEIEELKRQLKLQLQASNNSFFTAPKQSSQTSVLNTFGDLDLDDFEDDDQSVVVPPVQTTQVVTPPVQVVTPPVQPTQVVTPPVQPAQNQLIVAQPVTSQALQTVNKPALVVPTGLTSEHQDALMDYFQYLPEERKTQQSLDFFANQPVYWLIGQANQQKRNKEMRETQIVPSDSRPLAQDQTQVVPQPKIINFVSQPATQTPHSTNFNFPPNATFNIFNVNGTFHLHQN